MEAVQVFAANGGLVLGVCNGFQILCEAGLLPGALIRNRSLQFRCETHFPQDRHHRFTFHQPIPEDKLLRVPIAHGEGCYFADDETLASAQGQESNPLALRRCSWRSHRNRQSQWFSGQHRGHLQ